MPTIDLRVQRRGQVAWLTLGGDGRALTPALVDHIGGTLASVADEPDVRVAVLDGAFPTAWDRDALDRVCTGSAGLRRLSSAFSAISETPLPVIAALDGEVLSAGLELALVCDVRLATADARLGFPESAAGALPVGGGAARLARLAGRAMALRMLLTGVPISAGEALACGLVSGVHPTDQLAAETERLAAAIASRGPIAVRYAKEAVSRGTEMPLEQALRYETDLTIILQATADRAEGVRAFVEKRPPNFQRQ